MRGLVAGADRWRHTAAAAASEAPGTSTTEEAPLLLRYEALVPGQLVKRYKRFLGDVLLDGDGSSGGNAPAAAAAAAPAQSTQAAVTVVHVPNTGPMTGLLDALPAPALLSVSTDPKRKYAHTLEWLCPAGQGSWVGTHSAKANAMVRAMLEQRLLGGHLPPYDRIQAEVKYGADGKSRVDFVLHSGPDGAASSSAALTGSKQAKRRRGAKGGGEDRPQQGGRIALFPDTVSERAQKHVRELTAVAAGGGDAALLFLVQRDDCTAFAPCHQKDPVYGRLVRQAAAAGVRVLPGRPWPCTPSMAGAPASKRTKINGGSTMWEHHVGPTYTVTGLQLTDHTMSVPLDHTGATPGTVDIFFRELVHRNKKDEKGLGYLLFLQGGPGFEAARPTELSGWVKQASNYFRIILLDQRGTGRSTAVTPDSLVRRGSPAEQAAYLKFFRADSIVRDAELIRRAVVPQSGPSAGRWSILGQSFGGFCAATYLSLAPEGLVEVLMTGGIPPGIDQPCSAEDVYRRTFRRCLAQNKKFYQRFPMDVERVQRIVKFLAAQPNSCVTTPMGNRLTPRSFQLVGLQALGFSHGFERLHYLLESAWDGDHISHKFMKDFDSWMAWDTNPLYALLHEAIYCQGAASNWAAHLIRESEFAFDFDAVAQAQAGQPVMFTGEMVFPWMFEDFKELAKLREAAELLAADADWPALYDVGKLQQNTVPVAAATYYEDMFVDFDLAQGTAAHIQGIRQWITNEYLHCGIREAGITILERLLNIARGGVLLR
ncbi:Proline iminopeptidase [Micractinium conductrix]|uniref:Proline iminopeptidase n=1 Tax=Micractinium conductrix TaxID=554055 RepID=A0A2P6V9U3_9CHLO|nr:Proline iminopeptidase [Micractinium conductrix]|eukprot:PSC70862.1 Proline iminopeptidase [Micractinium conductrix]